MMVDGRTEMCEIWYNTERRFEHPECFILKLKFSTDKIPNIGDTIAVVNKKGDKYVKVVGVGIGTNTIILVEDVK